MSPLPDAFPDASSWCSALRPFVPEEVRAGLAQELQRLAALPWLPLDGLPDLSRSDGRAGGGGGGAGTTGNGSGGVGAGGGVVGEQEQQQLIHSAWCSLVFTLRGREGGWGSSASSGGGGGGRAGGGGEGERQPQEPPLKPTDVVLLTNSRVRRGLRGAGSGLRPGPCG